MFDEKRGLMMICEMKDDTLLSDANYYSDSTLIISIKKQNSLIVLYYGQDTLYGYFKRNEDGSRMLVSLDDVRFEDKVQGWFYDNASIMSMFYGGEEALLKYITEQVDYNNTKYKKGRVKVQFYIDANGYTCDIKVLEKSKQLLNDEAIRIIKHLPRWQPGHQAGKFVKTSYVIPIVFDAK